MTDRGIQIAEQLVKAGLVSKADYNVALGRCQQYGGDLQEVLIEQGSISEEQLLKFLASAYKTRFVTTEKLRVAQVGRNLLEKIPLKIAIKYNVIPILFDAGNNALSIIIADPSNLMALREVQAVAKVAKLHPYVARTAAIEAGIQRFYKGDIHAFSKLDTQEHQMFTNMMNQYERNLLDETSMDTVEVEETPTREKTFSEKELERKRREQAKQGASMPPPPAKTEVKAPKAQSNQDMVETINILVSLLENSRGDLAGHSALTARYARRIAKRLGLGEGVTANLAIACLIHDLGKGSPYHLTALNVAEWDGHRKTAVKRFEIPIRLFDSVKLPEESIKAVRLMYERFDGQGIPEGLKGKAIPLGARILTIVDTYADLTVNPRNPYRKTLSSKEAIQVLSKQRDTVFDGNLLDIFGMTMAGEDIKEKLTTEGQSILFVDSDAEIVTVMELQLVSQGFRVHVARTADQALEMLNNEKISINVVITELDLEPFDGFELINKMGDKKRTSELPVIILTNRAGSDDVRRGFESGAADYMVKPAKTDVLVAKLGKISGQKPAAAAADGVSGSLKEMSLPDLVQILFHGRKSGQLKLNFKGKKGEIHFSTGHIANAIFGQLQGEDAFFEMLKFHDGSFSLNPKFEAGDIVIQESPEMLLLEGMRRMDEETR